MVVSSREGRRGMAGSTGGRADVEAELRPSAVVGRREAEQPGIHCEVGLGLAEPGQAANLECCRNF